MHIKIKDIVKDNNAISYACGEECLDLITNFINKNNNEKIELDFEGIEFVITAFLNPIIGDLILLNGEGIMDRIIIKNANATTLEKIKMVKDGTLVKMEDLFED